jgi:2-polyprenyl-3-methyl-5-hydroxy-6-metoxy-1,4-benzoquinol methylase
VADLACPWCGEATEPAGRRLRACRGCGAALTDPPPDDAELAAAYAGSYRPAGGRFGPLGDRVLARTRGSLARRLDRLAPPGPVLDVGSGDGTLLGALSRQGRDALGLERDAPPRPDVVAAELTEFDTPPASWAAVVMWHSLEHLRDAPAALDRACELLAPGGVLILAVPNRASWQARIFGDRWFALDLPRHLSHLTPEALLRRLDRRGMVTERVSFLRGGQVLFGWLHGLVVLLPGHPDLYDAIRRPEARSASISPRRRAATLAAGAGALPLASALALAEVLARAGGTVFIQARRPAA